MKEKHSSNVIINQNLLECVLKETACLSSRFKLMFSKIRWRETIENRLDPVIETISLVIFILSLLRHIRYLADL